MDPRIKSELVHRLTRSWYIASSTFPDALLVTEDQVVLAIVILTFLGAVPLGFARALKVVRIAPAIAHLEEKINILKEEKKKVKHSSSKHKK